MLYSVYSFPNIILPFFGGILIDKLGVRVAILIFSTVLIAGQMIFTLGGFLTKYWLMILGRTLFGIGSESLTAA
jgi:MFS family permease